MNGGCLSPSIFVVPDGRQTGVCGSAIRPDIAGYNPDSQQWTLYTNVYPPLLSHFCIRLFLRLGSSGRPLSKRKPANGSYRLSLNRLHSFYGRWIGNAVLDDRCKTGLRNLFLICAGTYTVWDLYN
jgi:hypothetical protein